MAVRLKRPAVPATGGHPASRVVRAVARQRYVEVAGVVAKCACGAPVSGRQVWLGLSFSRRFAARQGLAPHASEAAARQRLAADE